MGDGERDAFAAGWAAARNEAIRLCEVVSDSYTTKVRMGALIAGDLIRTMQPPSDAAQREVKP